MNLRSPSVLFAILFVGGCTTVSDLRPAFEANRQNITDVRTNSKRIALSLKSAGNTLFELSRIRWQREICLRIQSLGESLKSRSGETELMNADFSALPTTEAHELIDRHRSAITKSRGKIQLFARVKEMLLTRDTQRHAEVERKYPVAAPVVQGYVDEADVIKQYATLCRNVDLLAISEGVQRELASQYPAIVELRAKHTRFLQLMDEYIAVLDKQTALAVAHAEIFMYAANTNMTIEEAFASVLGDEGFQVEVLSQVKDEKTKSIISDAMVLLESVRGSSEGSWEQ